MDGYLTVGQFAGLLEKNVYHADKGTGKVDWDVPQHSEELIKRRTAAGMVHHVLLRMGEADEESIESALRLKDLYSCRTCVGHIVQVYVKGIMTEWSDGAFGAEEQITYREAEEIVKRVADSQLRKKPGLSVRAGLTTVMWQEAEQMLKEDRRILLVDVRSGEEYGQGHRKGSINVPLQALFRNPYCVCADRAAVLFLYCQRGYKSRIAAELLARAGYGNVYVVLCTDQEF